MDTLGLENVNEKKSFIKVILNNTLKELMSSLGADCGSLFLFDSENKELVLEAFYNSVNLTIRGLRKRIGEGITGVVAKATTPVLVKNLDEDNRFKRNGFNHYRSKSFISIPLTDSKGMIGLINLTDKASGDYFDEKDLSVSVLIVRYACQVVDIFKESVEISREKEMLDRQKMILEKYASVGKLAAGIVHEINNPLDGIIRYSNILLGQLEENSAGREYLLEMKTGLNRIANITKSLLEFSRIVNSKTTHGGNYVNMNTLIDESLDILLRRLNGSIKVNKQYKEPLPKIIDFGIQHVFVNIIKNALDAMPGEGTLDIHTDINDDLVRVVFKDSGHGVADEIKERIFEPFFTTKPIDQGTGLGLAICKEIVHKYEGEILLESSLNQGSAFTILIPKKFTEDA